MVHNSAADRAQCQMGRRPSQEPGRQRHLPAGGNKEVKLKADKQPIAISCNIHPWMKGYMCVFDHPYFAVTDDDGNFEIKNVPAGKLQMVIWQEDMGF